MNFYLASNNPILSIDRSKRTSGSVLLSFDSTLQEQRRERDRGDHGESDETGGDRTGNGHVPGIHIRLLGCGERFLDQSFVTASGNRERFSRTDGWKDFSRTSTNASNTYQRLSAISAVAFPVPTVPSFIPPRSRFRYIALQIHLSVSQSLRVRACGLGLAISDRQFRFPI